MSRAIFAVVRVTWRLGLLAILPLCGVYACSLTDLDGLATGDGVTAPDGGHDGTTTSTDGAPVVAAETGSEAGPGGEAGAPTYGDVVRGDHPVAYFPFDEAVGAKSSLEAISGQHGVVSGDLVFGAKGIAGTAVRSTGLGGIDFGQILTFTGEAPYSVEAWTYPVVGADQEFYEYFNKRDGTENGMVMYVRRNDDSSVTMQLEQNWGGGGRGVSMLLPPLDHFIHLVFVYTPGKGVQAWSDGKHSDFGYDAKGGPTVAGTPCAIARGIRGTIDEMAVYDYPLSATQIAAHFSAGTKAR